MRTPQRKKIRVILPSINDALTQFFFFRCIAFRLAVEHAEDLTLLCKRAERVRDRDSTPVRCILHDHRDLIAGYDYLFDELVQQASAVRRVMDIAAKAVEISQDVGLCQLYAASHFFRLQSVIQPTFFCLQRL